MMALFGKLFSSDGPPDQTHFHVRVRDSILFPRGEAFTAGCEAYIVKPIDTPKLASQVAAVAEKHQT